MIMSSEIKLIWASDEPVSEKQWHRLEVCSKLEQWQPEMHKQSERGWKKNVDFDAIEQLFL